MKTTVAPLRETRIASLARTAHRWRAVLFAFGDFLFLLGVGAVTTLVMHGMHQLGWNFALTCVLGMAVAMLVQMLMAFCAAPLLGSIETMTPSMVVGMVSPMSVCATHMFGRELDHMTATSAGAVFGLAMFAFLQIYGARVKRSFYRLYEGSRGDPCPASGN
ncbi:MAG: hypothetical protein L6R00_17310 [Phycisphaerae bacterium]|nr:hypothetical protein [Phycisphaerae bacterium]